VAEADAAKAAEMFDLEGIAQHIKRSEVLRWFLEVAVLYKVPRKPAG
jgi:hypothetical protein